MATYVTICTACPFERYFAKQARANAAKQSHGRGSPAHDVRVARVRRAGRTPFQREVRPDSGVDFKTGRL
jgi:hypothetical protein